MPADRDARGAREAWEAIAPGFAAARQEPWPFVVEALRTLPAGARVADVGAGGGRHARAAREMGLEVVALDAARAFVHGWEPGLRSRGAQGDAAALPLRDASLDAVLLVAVLGTMPRREDRVAALREARRVLRPGGLLLATVWAKWQPRYLRALVGRGPWRRTGPGAVEAPWPQGKERVGRPYTLYTRGSFQAALAAAGWTGARVEGLRVASGPWVDNFLVRATR